ncbi:acyl-CoA thioesterase [Thermoflavimicrobium daqui]|jgi:acyl-CoA thioester hydrolase|uniref:4-hydroxybenzoyl-CoA thioesterase n=1 Tax=Thermoflavimicrobium daqui TaxID=2137476 RepID=A0A364K9F9_9BACL|nr:thioesterase family protein [Thermoflavimicrobium daqui]RAL26840.1 4-hydroxybenzoyl-CoA thioesterase [Thermoflavimicrobium daqui]
METNKSVSETIIRVRYQETDQMGVVYHTNYMVWFEVARTDFVRDIGLSYRDMEKLGVLLPVIEVNCVFRSPARYDDEIIIKTYVKELSGSKVIFEYEVLRKEDNKLLATGFSKHLWVNREMKRINLAHVLPDIYERLLQYAPNEEA